MFPFFLALYNHSQVSIVALWATCIVKYSILSLNSKVHVSTINKSTTLLKNFFLSFRNRFTDYFQPIFEEVFGPPRQRTGLSTLLSERIDLQMDQSAPPNPSGPAPNPTTELSSSTSAVRSGTESGWITPEEVSNITSSDAATVHSSDSGILKFFVMFLTPLKFCCS